MPINGKTYTMKRSEEKAGLPGHGPVIAGVKFAADQGVYPVGLLLTRLITNILVALQVIVAEVLGAGDGVTKVFSGNLGASPIEPGTVTVTDGVEVFVDDGSGRLVGDAGGSGTINYRTGAIAVSFNANVGNTVAVTVDYVTSIDSVLDQEIDTAEEQSGNAVIHGTVAVQALKIGAVDKAAPSATVLGLLRAKGIYPI